LFAETLGDSEVSGLDESASTPAERLFREAVKSLAAGVTAGLRWHPYLGHPFYVSRGEGPYLYDLGGRRVVDFNMANGAVLLGHGHPAVVEAVQTGLAAGVLTASETEHHVRLAESVCRIVPCAERVRFAATGTEAVLVAVRLARHSTGRRKILLFAGHYHGLAEPFLFRPPDPAGDGKPRPASGGVPATYGEDVIIVPWNDAEAVDRALARHRGEIAAVLCEPVHYNAGCIPPQPGFLPYLRDRTQDEGIVLIFDEVLSGFRMALGGAQQHFGVTPDLSTLAKAVANGMPLAVICGRADLMEQLSPAGPVAHSGTYSGQLLSVLAALATLRELQAPGLYPALNSRAERFYSQLQETFDRAGVPACVQGLGARFGIYFGRREPVITWAQALDCDHSLHRRFVLGCLERGLFFHAYLGLPGHAGFSLAHTGEVLDHALTVFEDVARHLATGPGG
jgi:glutamate-1-semialdehyde 2,1-aminomutase